MSINEFCQSENRPLIVRPDCLIVLRPVLPDEWRDVKIHRVFRNATYEIRILNRNSKGNAIITVDGKVIKGDILPDFNDEKIHDVCVEIV